MRFLFLSVRLKSYLARFSYKFGFITALTWCVICAACALLVWNQENAFQNLYLLKLNFLGLILIVFTQYAASNWIAVIT